MKIAPLNFSQPSVTKDGMFTPEFQRWLARLQIEVGRTATNPFNVRDFGATGNGSTDDTTAILSARSTAAGGKLFFPEGEYIYSGPLGIPNDSTWEGVYAKSILKIKTGAWSGAAFGLPPITNDDQVSGHNVVLRNLVFDGNVAGNPTPGAPGVMVSFRGVLNGWEISDCIIQNYPGASAGPPIGGSPVGIGEVGGSGGVRDGFMNDCVFLNTRGGAVVNFGPRNKFRNCKFEVGGSDAGFGAQDIYCGGTVFENCSVKDLTEADRYAYYVEGASGVKFVDCDMDNSNGVFISDFSIAKPRFNSVMGCTYRNAPAGGFPIRFNQDGVGLGASDNIVIFNMGQTDPTHAQYSINGTIGKNLVILCDNANGYIAFLDCVAKKMKWIAMDTFGSMAFLNDAKSIVMSIGEAAMGLPNSIPFQMNNNAGTPKTVLNMTSGDNFEIGGGMAAGDLILSAAGRPIRYGVATRALGAGAAATLGTIGGTGPATAAQFAWEEGKDSTGTLCWRPIWR